MEFVMPFAVLALAMGSGLWLFDLLRQRRAFLGSQARMYQGNAALSEHAWQERRARGAEPEVADRSQAMCGARRTFDDRGHSPTLADAQESLDRAASILHESGPSVYAGKKPEAEPWDGRQRVLHQTSTETL